MTDGFLAELVGGEIAFRGDEAHLAAGHKPAQCTEPATDRAVAFFDAVQIALDFEGDKAAVTTSWIDHGALFLEQGSELYDFFEHQIPDAVP